MIDIVGNMEGIPIYEDPLMEDNKILQGRKHGVEGIIYIIANPKTAQLIYKTFLIKSRKEKLDYLNNL